MKKGLLSIGLAAALAAGCGKDRGGTPGSTGAPPAEAPAGASEGVTFTAGGASAVFELYAPGKKSVSVIGDFNAWKPSAPYAMTRTPDGTRWWVEVDGLDPQAAYGYQYLIDDTLRVADPYAHEILDPDNDPGIPPDVYPGLKAYPVGKTTGLVGVAESHPPSYTWKTAGFTRPDPRNLVIYELLVRDFVAAHSYQVLTDTLDYLSRLGVNAVELMPVNEFEGNDSWGYNTNFLFALDKYYGTPVAYKAFIDACHARGIAVIQDIVLEDQFGSSPMVRMYATPSGAPAADNPWFDTENRHPDAVGYQLNHESQATRDYAERVMQYWMTEYHIDGFRFDQAKGFTQTRSSTEDQWAAYDASRVATWETYDRFLKGLDPTFYVILEYFASNQEEAQLAADGMMMWTNLSNAAEQAAMGYPSGNGTWDLSGLFYDGYGFSGPAGLVGYFESHDEERLQFKNEAYGNASGGYDIKKLPTGLARDALDAVFLFSAPGPKMLWQFGERGYDVSINDGGRLGDKDPHWEYMQDPDRRKLYATYAQLIRLKTANPVYTTAHFSYSLQGPVKTIRLLGEDGTDVVVVGNFDVVAREADIGFPAAGTWYDNLRTGYRTLADTVWHATLAPGEYHVFSNRVLRQ